MVVNEIENESELVEATTENGCIDGEVCYANEWFECITICKLCGKLC